MTVLTILLIIALLLAVGSLFPPAPRHELLAVAVLRVVIGLLVGRF